MFVACPRLCRKDSSITSVSKSFQISVRSASIICIFISVLGEFISWFGLVNHGMPWRTRQIMRVLRFLCSKVLLTNPVGIKNAMRCNQILMWKHPMISMIRCSGIGATRASFQSHLLLCSYCWIANCYSSFELPDTSHSLSNGASHATARCLLSFASSEAAKGLKLHSSCAN